MAKTRPPKILPPAHAMPLAQINLLNRLARRHADITYGGSLGMTLSECWSLSVIVSGGGASIKALSTEAGLDKGQASRTTRRLIELGMVAREQSPDDLRQFDLKPTALCLETNARYMAMAAERNDKALSVLTPDERVAFLDALERVLAHLRTLTEPEAD